MVFDESTLVKADEATLTEQDRDDFAQLDAAIRRHIQGFVQVGLYLKEVQARRLYRESFSTFEAYLADLGLKRQRAYELIEAADVAESVSEISDIKVERESHAAALADVPVEERVELLTQVKADSGGKVTAKAIHKAKKVRAGSFVTLTDQQTGGFYREGDVVAVRKAENIPQDDPVWCRRTGQPHAWESDGDETFCRDCLQPRDQQKIINEVEHAPVLNVVSAEPDGPAKLNDKELRTLKVNVASLWKNIATAQRAAERIEGAIGAPDEELIEVQQLLRRAFTIARGKERGWAAIKNKRRMGRDAGRAAS